MDSLFDSHFIIALETALPSWLTWDAVSALAAIIGVLVSFLGVVAASVIGWMAYRVSRSATELVEQAKEEDRRRRSKGAKQVKAKLLSVLLHFCIDFGREVSAWRRRNGDQTDSVTVLQRMQLAIDGFPSQLIEEVMGESDLLSEPLADLIRDLLVSGHQLCTNLTSVTKRPPFSRFGKDELEALQRERPDLIPKVIARTEKDFEALLDAFDRVLDRVSHESGWSAGRGDAERIRNIIGWAESPSE